MSRYPDWAKAHPIIANALTMLTGTGLSQLIPLAAAPVIARLYTPDDRAVYTYFLSIVAALTTLVALRYEQTIVLPESHQEARQLLRMTIRIAFLTSVLATVV